MGFKDEVEIKTAEDIVNEQLNAEPLDKDQEKEAQEKKDEAVGEEVKESESQPAEDNKEKESSDSEKSDIPSEDDKEDSEEDETESDDSEEEDEEEEAPKKKKNFILQPPIIIAACIVLGSLLGYFIFVAFFQHDPNGIWKIEDDEGTTYYYEFKDNNECILTLGGLDNVGKYVYSSAQEGNSLAIQQISAGYYYIGMLEGEYSCTITGSKLFGTQKMQLVTSDYSYELTQVNSKENPLEKPSDFTPNEDLLGEWEFYIPEYDVSYELTFNDDGTMLFNQMDTTYYRAVYTVDDENVYMTIYTIDESTTTLPYKLNGNTLHIMDADFIKAGTTATVDEVSLKSTNDEF